jgi:sugar phosphate permease
MLLAHRTSVILDRKNTHGWFIGWSLVVHGLLFALAGFMPTLLLFALLTFVSRAIVGAEYAIQETLFQRSLPDHIRGRISTLDRGAELTVFGIFSYISSAAMLYISPMALTVLSGLLSACAGVVWFARHRGEDFSLGVRERDVELSTENA